MSFSEGTGRHRGRAERGRSVGLWSLRLQRAVHVKARCTSRRRARCRPGTARAGHTSAQMGT